MFLGMRRTVSRHRNGETRVSKKPGGKETSVSDPLFLQDEGLAPTFPFLQNDDRTPTFPPRERQPAAAVAIASELPARW